MHSRSALRAACFVLAPLMAAACGQAALTTGDGGPDAGEAVALGDAASLGPSPTLAAFCNALVSATWASPAAPPDACDPVADPADEQYTLQAYCDVMEREVASGRLVFDPSHAAACVTAAQAAAAQPSRDVDVPECRGAAAGQLGAGQSCHYGSPLELSVGIGLAVDGRPLISTCASGLYCAQAALAADASPSALMCDGVCAAIGKVNEPCPTARGCNATYCAGPCEQGSVCASSRDAALLDASSADASSGNGILCVQRPKEGEPCDVTAVEMCADGLFCSLLVTGSDPYQTVCRAQVAAETPCSRSGVRPVQAPPNVCYAAPGSDAGARCVPVPLLQPGESCSLEGPAQCGCPNECIDGTCVAAKNVGGSPCTFGGATELPCRDGTCDPTEGDGGTCVANLAPGMPCDPAFPSACGWETCDQTSQRCTPQCF